MIDNKDLGNKRHGVDGVQIIFNQQVDNTSTNDYGEVYQYFEFYDTSDNPIINPTYNSNIWNLKRYVIGREDKIYYNFIQLSELPMNLGSYKQVVVLNPKQEDVIIKVNYTKVSLVLDTTKLNNFTDGEIIK